MYVTQVAFGGIITELLTQLEWCEWVLCGDGYEAMTKLTSNDVTVNDLSITYIKVK